MKCFASRSNEKRKAFSLIRRELWSDLSTQLYWFTRGLWGHWFKKGKVEMREPLTTKDVLELGKMWGDNVFTVVPPEEVVGFYKPEELFSHLQAKDAARYYKPQELLSGLPQEEIEAYLRSLKIKKEPEQN